MQDAIARNAHRLQYALIDDFPDDAVDIILRGAYHHAASLSHHHIGKKKT